MDYMQIPYGLGEGFLEFCSNQNTYDVDNSYYTYGNGYTADIYDNVPPFQHDDFLSSPESDQENVIGYYDTNIMVSDFNDECGGQRPKKVHQRKAANMRERRRMKSINDAFDHLRKRIPANTGADRRISKVDTLRLAISYISYLGELIKKCADNNRGPNSRHGMKKDKIILRCKSEFGSYTSDDGQPLIGHSITCSKDSKLTGSSILSAKIWTPQKPTVADIKNLSSGTSFINYSQVGL